MVFSKSSSSSASKLRNSHSEQGSDAMANLARKIMQLKKQIQSERVVSVGEKIEKNRQNVQSYVSNLERLASSRVDSTITTTGTSDSERNLLSLRMQNPICKIGGITQLSVDTDNVNSDEIVLSTTVKLPQIEKIPPYTTWMFLDKNQRMADDQSVVGRRRIYYDQHGSEALICSDSEEELGEMEVEKHEFSEGEDRILRLAFQEYEINDEVLGILSQFVQASSSEIKERCNMLMQIDQETENDNSMSSGDKSSEKDSFLDKSLNAALDSFDNLFCCRCLVFDCRLHGCSQNLIYPSEKQPYTCSSEEERKPCGKNCYLLMNNPKDATETLPVASDESRLKPSDEEPCDQILETKGKNVMTEPSVSPSDEDTSLLISDDLQSLSNKELKVSFTEPGERENLSSTQELDDVDLIDCIVDKSGNKVRDKGKGIVDSTLVKECNKTGETIKSSNKPREWKPMEKDLYSKGLEIFGRNSCLIARNLLGDLRTCKEVFGYMCGDGEVARNGSSAVASSFHENAGNIDITSMDTDMPVKSRVCRKRGRARKVKSSWKSAGHPSLWRRIADGKDQSCKQYTPCGCESLCGKDCSCLKNGMCCEKYCGCSKSCKNRFRGCHCAKSQCKSRQCPCFAAGRECDPDVCRNCWVSCGDGSLGEPPRQGDGQCGNMRLLLRQQQKILLAKSDVAGWGAFLKNSVNKNDYLGEYTGELISHREADKRGKIYDRANSSFLFDLNDQYVLDAYRKGDKLKFANHSSNPNCYAKVMLVAGDHRVGIFANERIEAGEELFYDYRYGPDQAPAWARKPESSKREDSTAPHQGRAKKHQSG